MAAAPTLPVTRLAFMASDRPEAQEARERLLAARKRFNANDNIADFLQTGELEHCWTKSNKRTICTRPFAPNSKPWWSVFACLNIRTD